MATEIPAPKASDGRRLLVVDDDREIRDLLSALLTRRGYKVVTAREEHEMRQILESSRVDLIILDLMLPGKDGLTICRELRATKAIPIIMLTARVEEADRLIGLELGADDYILKPFSPREVVARVRARHRSARDLQLRVQGGTRVRVHDVRGRDGCPADRTDGSTVGPAR